MNINVTLLTNLVSTLQLIAGGLEDGFLTVTVPDGADAAKQNLLDTIYILCESVGDEILGGLSEHLTEANETTTPLPENVVVFPANPLEA